MRTNFHSTALQVNAAAAQVFKCFLSGNVDAQQNIGATLMPQPSFDDDPDMPAQVSVRICPSVRLSVRLSLSLSLCLCLSWEALGQEESIGRMLVTALVNLGDGSLPKVSSCVKVGMHSLEFSY